MPQPADPARTTGRRTDSTARRPAVASGPRQVGIESARRIAIAAQGLAAPRPAPFAATTRDLQRVIDRVGVIQIDSVNVLARSQYLPFFARLGPYDTALLDRARDRSPRRLVEYWAHEASLVPPATWPLLDFRMRRAELDSWGGMQRVLREQPDLLDAVLSELVTRGPLTSRGVEAALAHDQPRSSEHWGWNWSQVKQALEFLFWSGKVSSAGRTSSFERLYALPERVAPPSLRSAWLERPGEEADPERFVRLTRIAARAHGIGTERCLADYFRMSRQQTRPAIQTLVDAGELEPVVVPGWGAAYLCTQARRPRAVHAEALLSPFDSLVWQRERIQALWDFHYRIEIYTPAHRRVHGYYVLPFLFGERLVARADLKADRQGGRLVCHRVTWEAHVLADPGLLRPAREALERELDQMAAWMRLEPPR